MEKLKQLQIVTYEQAMRLEAVGFNFKVPSFYIRGEFFEKTLYQIRGFKNWKGWHCWEATQGIRHSAPTVALALKWCRDVMGVIGICKPVSTFKNKFSAWVYITIVYSSDMRILANKWENDGCTYDKYEEAESVMLDEILSLLEQQ